jgi:hypothetical protein
MAAETSTVDFANPISWCTGERTSHYTIGDTDPGAGMLGIATQWKCTNSSGRGRVGICQLDQNLKCRSDIQPLDKSGHPTDMSGYAVSMQGVTAKGTFFQWADAKAASAIVITIQELVMAGMCRYALIKAGVILPTAKETAEDEQNNKSSLKITVDTSPERLTSCKTTIHKFCDRTDLPASLTQLDNYKVLCGGSRVN